MPLRANSEDRTLSMSSDADVERVARAFHDAYEGLAPTFGYSTRRESATSWERVPEDNRRLMMATVRTLLRQGVISVAS